MAQLISVRLQRSEGQPWGFRLQGGKDFGTQLVLQKVNVGSIADKAGLIAGDAVIRVNNEEVFNLRHKDAQDVILRGGNSFELTVSRGGSTWRPSVTPLTSPVPTPTGVQVLTKTSLAANARTPTPNIGSGHNNAARPFGGNNNLVNKQFNSPIQCYNEQTIAETISAQSEILAGGAIGVNFKKNEKQFNPEQSAVLRALQESDNEPEPEPTSEVYSSPSFAPSSTPSSVTRHVSAPANVPVPKPSNGLPPGQNICADCERLIVGVFVRIKDKNLHVECFKCATCGTSLKNQGYYHLNNKLYCDIHARLAALNSPPPNTNGQVPVAIPPKTSASTISSALSSHVNNLSLNGSSLPASFAPPAAPAAVPTTDITPTHSRDSSVSSGYGKSCSPTPSPLDSESGIDEAVPSPYGSLFFKTSNGKIIRSVRPPSKDGTNFYKDKFAPSNGPRPFAQSAPAPAALAPKSPVAYPPPGPPTWAAPEPAAAPAPAPAAAPGSRRWENRQTAIKKLDAMLQARLKFNSKEPLSTPPTPTKPLNAMPLIKVEEEDLPPPPLPKSLPPIEDACLDVTLPDDLPLPPPPPEEPVSKPTPKFLTVKRILPPDYRPQKGVDKENNNNTLNLKNFASKTFETEKPLIETHQASTEEPICSVCDTKIQRGPFITALGRIWCPEHFICVNADCKRPLADIGFVEEKGDLYCEYCFEQYLAPSCKKCNRKIKGDCLNAIGKQFHPECFTCQYCGKLFGNSPFFLEEGEPYCEADWNELFTTKCFACGFPVEAGDRWVEALNNNYHSQCFNCTMCKKNLEGQSFYAKAGRPFCKNHAR